MYRFSQLSAKPPAKPPPTQNCYFIMMMLLGNYQILSGGMLCQQGLLRRGEKLLLMSDKSKRFLLQTYADQHANLTPRQLQKLMLFRFRAFLWARLLGKQSWQHAGIIVQPDVLRHLMTKCIPRISISPIRMPERPVRLAWQLTGSVVYDPSGYYDWSPYHQHITAITSHSKYHLIARMHSDGNVSIGKIGDPDNFFRVIHFPKKDDERATAISFHPFDNIIVVAIRACIMVYKISPSLKPELHFTLSFYEWGYVCPKSKFSADNLDWNPTGTVLTAISRQNLSMCFFLKQDTIEVIGGFNGGTPKYAELCSLTEKFLPSCSCFSIDGKLAVTGYSDGTLMARSAKHTPDTRVTMSCLKISDKVLPGQIDKIVPNPHDPSVFAIQLTSRWSQTSVLIALVSPDGSVTITATIPDAKSPHFHEDWLLVSSGKRILFHHMNRCNIPCLVTEFHLQGNCTMCVKIDAFCVIKTPDGKIMLYYTDDENSKLHMAEIKLK